jgi:hypothetical protein
MGFFDKIPFVKKKNSEDSSYSFANDNSGLDNENMGFDRTGMPESDMFDVPQADSNIGIISEKKDFDRTGMPTHENFSSQNTSALGQADFDANNPQGINSFKQIQKTTTSDKELELISAKLDTIKLILDNLDMRIANLEKIAKE